MSHELRTCEGSACPDFGELERAASAEGHGFVTRTRQEWETGANRFDRPGEIFFVVTEKDRLVGMCGMNRDPYVDDPRVGRLRHLYVHPDARRRGLAQQLVAACLDSAANDFDRVRLRTSNPAASALYVSIGFATVDHPSATHELRLQA